MKYGIAILPSEEVQHIANGYRKRYDPHYERIAPHITLREPFELETADALEALVASVSDIAQSTAPFTLSISKFSTFHPVNNVIYLVVDDNEAINELHQKLQISKEEERPYAFIPHVTIAQKMDMDELLDVYSGIKMNDVQANFTVQQFHLFQQEEDLTWSVVKTFDLKG